LHALSPLATLGRGYAAASVADLEGDDLQLDRALQLFEEGVERLRAAAGELARAEARVQQLVETVDGGLALAELGR
jgi:exodeoxyribonuclease VII small subunit